MSLRVTRMKDGVCAPLPAWCSRELTFADLGGKSPVLQRGEDTVLAYQLSNKMKNKVVWVNTDLVGLVLHLFCSLLMPQQDS